MESVHLPSQHHLVLSPSKSRAALYGVVKVILQRLAPCGIISFLSYYAGFWSLRLRCIFFWAAVSGVSCVGFPRLSSRNIVGTLGLKGGGGI